MVVAVDANREVAALLVDVLELLHWVVVVTLTAGEADVVAEFDFVVVWEEVEIEGQVGVGMLKHSVVVSQLLPRSPLCHCPHFHLADLNWDVLLPVVFAVAASVVAFYSFLLSQFES